MKDYNQKQFETDLGYAVVKGLLLIAACIGLLVMIGLLPVLLLVNPVAVAIITVILIVAGVYFYYRE